MDKFKMNAVISHISEPTTGKTKTGEPSKKLTVVLTQLGVQYPNSVALDYYKSGDNIKFIDSFIKDNNVGDEVEVEFNSSAREYQGKYYNSLGLWNISTVKSATAEAAGGSGEESSDLPF